MIIDGLHCQKCDRPVLDNPDKKECPSCGTAYPPHVLLLITSHHEAKMRMVEEGTRTPIAAVTALAEASRKAVALFKDA